MKLTRFDKLEVAIRLIGGTKVSAALVRALSTGTKDVSPDDLITGEQGIYYLTDEGVLTRVIVNVVDKNIRGRYFKPEWRAFVEKAEYEAETLVEGLHRYHLVRCNTIERAENEGWRDKYKMSHRRDGRFFYRFIADDKVHRESKDQRLHFCMNCLRRLAEAGIVPAGIEKGDFEPRMFFDYAEANEVTGLKEGGEYAEHSVPNKYAKDWRLIAQRLKEKRGFRCEESDCLHPDLSAPNLRRFLHAHHVDMDKSNNNFSNLQLLCIGCHAEQPGHSHMKGTRDYKEYQFLVGGQAISGQRRAAV